MKPPVIHYTLKPTEQLHSTYLSTLTHNSDEGPINHPGSFSARGSNLKVRLFHGRDSIAEEMNGWGFDGPSFDCLSVVHDPDLVLLQSACAVSLELAKRAGLPVHDDTIVLAYTDDLLTVPLFQDQKPAYFGDLVIEAV